MNRYTLLKEFYDLTAHNLYCYSADSLMTRAKDGFEESWYKEKEKLELIEELIEDEKQSKFKLYYSIKSLKEIKGYKTPTVVLLEDNKISIKEHYIEDGFSAYLLLSNINEEVKKLDKYLKG